MSGESKPGWKALPIGAVPYKFSTEYKTGDWRSFKPILDNNKCVKCMLCVLFCPDMAIHVKWEEGGPRPMPKELWIDYNYCKGCGICANVCPVKAITMEPEG